MDVILNHFRGTARCHPGCSSTAVPPAVNLFYLECTYFTVNPLAVRLFYFTIGSPMIIRLCTTTVKARSRRWASSRRGEASLVPGIIFYKIMKYVSCEFD